MNKQNRFFSRMGGFIGAYPLPIALFFLVLVALSLVAAAGISLKTQVKDLLPEDNPQAREYEKITDDFQTASLLLVTVQGADHETVINGAEALAERVRADRTLAPLIASMNLKIDREFLTRWGLLLQDTKALEDNEKVFSDIRLLPLLRTLNGQLEETLWSGDAEQEIDSRKEEDDAVEMMNRLDLFFSRLFQVLREGSGTGSDISRQGGILAEDFLFGEEYGMNADGTFLMFTIKPSFTLMDREKIISLSDGVRGHIKALGGRFPSLIFGTTGDISQEADEERAMGADVLYPSLLAFSLIVALFFFSFANRRSVGFTAIALVTGIVLDLGLSAVVIGELNMITSSFGALLVGLGIDFGLHVIGRHDELKTGAAYAKEPVKDLLASIGLPVFLGAVTTALAFYALLFSQTKGFRQFGFVAGSGILTTLLCMLVLLPALLTLFPGRKPLAGKRRLDYVFLGTLGRGVRKTRYVVIPLFFALCVLSVFSIPSNAFEYDMRKIGPQGTESRAAEDRLMRAMDLSSFTSMVLYHDPEQARRMTIRLEEAPRVGNVESITRFLPGPDEQGERMKIIARMRGRRRYDPVFNWNAERVTELADEIQRLEYNIIEFGDLSAAVLGEDNKILKKRHVMIREMYGAETAAPGREVFAKVIGELTADPDHATAVLSLIDDAFAGQADSLLDRMTAVTRPLTLQDIPADIRSMFVSADGASFLVMVYPDKTVKSEQSLLDFHRTLSAIEPRATGSLHLGIALSEEILGEAARAVFLVGTVILIILLVTFRNLWYALLCLGSLCLGVVLMLGIYPLFGRLNMINLLAVPLIIGIGIDYSIHIVHRFRNEPGIPAILQTTGKAILLSGLTTMFGFGSLALAGQFRGIATLGSLLFTGTAVCLAVSLVLLPALLTLIKPASNPQTRRNK